MRFDYSLRFAAKYFFVAIFLVSSILIAVNNAPFTQDYQAKSDKFEAERLDLQAITVGYSVISAIHFQSMGLKGTHFFDVGADLESAVRKGERLLRFTPALEYLLVPIAETGLTRQVQYSLHAKRIFASVANNQPVVEITTIADFVLVLTRIKVALESGLSIIRARLKASILSGLNQSSDIPQGSKTCRSEGGGIPWTDGIPYGYRVVSNPMPCLLRSARIRAQTFHTHYRRLPDPITVANANIAKLERLAVLARRRNARLVLVRTPLIPQLRDLVTNISHLNFLQKSEILRNDAFMIDGSDFFDASLTSGSNKYFFDSNHINLAGAKLFSSFVKKQLQSLESIKSKTRTEAPR